MYHIGLLEESDQGLILKVYHDYFKHYLMFLIFKYTWKP